MSEVVLFDMDGMLVDLHSAWLARLNEKLGTKVKLDQITTWDWCDSPPFKGYTKAEVEGPLDEPGLFLSAQPMPGGIWAMEAIARAGCQVMIASSPYGPVSAKEKLEWLRIHAPFLSRKDVILANKKTMIKADYLLDDKLETLLAYAREWPRAKCFGISWPYNEPSQAQRQLIDSGYGRVALFPSWKAPRAAWGSIVDEVTAKA